MLLLLSAIGICGIFADERINGTDQIIFSSVSKEKLFIAKILAGLSMGIILAVYLYGALSICSFGIYGFSGFNAPLQIRIPGCMPARDAAPVRRYVRSGVSRRARRTGFSRIIVSVAGTAMRIVLRTRLSENEKKRLVVHITVK